jgi:hypothetical protein
VHEYLKPLIWETLARLDDARNIALGRTGIPSAERDILLGNTQADLVSLALASRQVELTQGGQDTELAVIEAPGAVAPTNQSLDRARNDPTTVRDLVLNVQPTPGGAWDILQGASLQTWLDTPMPESEDEFFEGLAFKTASSKGEPPESEEYWSALQDAQAAPKRRQPIRDRLGSQFTTYKGPRDEGARQRTEDVRLRNLKISFGHNLPEKPEEGLRAVKKFIEGQNDSFQALREEADPNAAFQGQAPIPLAPGHERRFRTYAVVAYGIRLRKISQEAADKGLMDDVNTLLDLRQQQRDSEAYAADPVAYMAGVRPDVSKAEFEDRALRTTLELQNSLRSTPPEEVLPTVIKAANTILEASQQRRTARMHAENPGAIYAGQMPPLTEEEFHEQLEATALVYRLTGGVDPHAAERLLNEFYVRTAQRLQGERQALGQVGGSPSGQYDSMTTKQLEGLVATTTEEVNRQRGQFGSPDPQLDAHLQELRQVYNARQDDPTGELTKAHLRTQQAAARDYRAQHPGDVLVGNGAFEATDGTPGALAVALVTRGVREIDISGDMPLGSGAVAHLGDTVLRRLDRTVIPGDRQYETVLFEGALERSIKPSLLLDQIAPNGFGAVPASLNLGLVARTLLRIDPEGYNKSVLPGLVAKYVKSTAERAEIERLRQSVSGRPGQYADTIRWSLVPSAVCRFEVAPDGQGLRVEQGHAVPRRGRPPDLTFVVFHNKPSNDPNQPTGDPSDLYQEIGHLLPESH